MRIFAIDTSQKTVSVAILVDTIILADIFINSGRHHSEILMPLTEQAFRLAGMQPHEIDLFAVTIGPGSFTGLRIGAAAIKGLILATGKPVVGVSTLDALAHGAVHAGKHMICPMLDAQKNQIYTTLYRSAVGMAMEKIGEEHVIDVDRWLNGLPEDIYFLGDGAVKYHRQIQAHFLSANCIAEGRQNHVSAVDVGVLAQDQYQHGDTLDLLKFTPRYLRPSEAEVRARQETSHIDKP
jgi:tRNA threonylcarbamoyladenosine biosynthesis protein TsaB